MRLSPAGKFWLAYLTFIATSILFARTMLAAEARFSWLPNTEQDLAGYRIYYGSSSRQYSETVDVGLPEPGEDGRIHYTMTVPDGTTYFAATAYDTAGNESDYSDEVSFDPPPGPPGDMTVVTVKVEVSVR